MLYLPRGSSFISTQFFALYIYIPLLYYYINLRSSIIFCLSSGDVYLPLDTSLSCSFVTVFELFWCEVFEIFCSFISNFITNQVISRICCFFELLFLKQFQIHLQLIVWYDQEDLGFFNHSSFYPCFWQKTKIHNLLQIFDLQVELNSASALIFSLITKVMFILSSIFSGLEF